jgi:hypothetical protein
MNIDAKSIAGGGLIVCGNGSSWRLAEVITGGSGSWSI